MYNKGQDGKAFRKLDRKVKSCIVELKSFENGAIFNKRRLKVLERRLDRLERKLREVY